MYSKWDSIFTEERLNRAVSKVARKVVRNKHGLSPKRVKEDITREARQKLNVIYDGNYYPDMVRIVAIPKAGGRGIRHIAVANVADRVIAACLNDYLYPQFTQDWSDNSFGFIKGKGCPEAVAKISDYLSQGYRYAVQVDLKSCFDNIDQNQARFLLDRKKTDGQVRKLINSFMRVVYKEGRKEERKSQGVPQGNPISPLLCNMVLDLVDKELEGRGLAFARYADDMILMSRSRRAAEATLKNAIGIIARKTKLIVNESKSGISNIQDGFNFLGFRFYEDRGGCRHLIPKEGKEKELRTLLKDEIRYSKVNKTVKRVNEIVRGWVGYYGVAEISKTARELDSYIGKRLMMKEKACGCLIDRSDLVNCHALYMNGRLSKRLSV